MDHFPNFLCINTANCVHSIFCVTVDEKTITVMDFKGHSHFQVGVDRAKNLWVSQRRKLQL